MFHLRYGWLPVAKNTINRKMTDYYHSFGDESGERGTAGSHRSVACPNDFGRVTAEGLQWPVTGRSGRTSDVLTNERDVDSDPVLDELYQYLVFRLETARYRNDGNCSEFGDYDEYHE